MSVTDKIVVITGASAGIGAEVAAVVAKRGGKPVLVARRADVLAEVSKKCGDALTIVADVTKRAEVHAAMSAALTSHGRVDVWINNAGRGISRMPSELTDDDVDEMMLVNVKSVLYGVQAVLPHMKERGTGQIINISSLLGRVPFAPIRSAYVAAKHALNGLTAALRIELKQTHPGIVVTSVHPGVVTTDFGKNAKHGGPDSRSLPNSQTAEEVAAVIVDAIGTTSVDVYTRPGARQMVAGYYAAEDMAVAEDGFARR